MAYKCAIWQNKSLNFEIWHRNCEFASRNSDLSQNSELQLKINNSHRTFLSSDINSRQINLQFLEIIPNLYIRYKLRVYILQFWLIFSEFWVYILQLITYNCKISFHTDLPQHSLISKNTLKESAGTADPISCWLSLMHSVL